MNPSCRFPRGVGFLVLVLALVSLGCEADYPIRSGPSSPKATPDAPKEGAPDKPKPPAKDPKGEEPPTAGAKRLGKDLYFERTKDDRRRVFVLAQVCLREGQFGLECLLCRKGTKEHESLLTTEAEAEFIHAALKAAGAEPGKPVEFEPKFQPPSGARIKVTLQYPQKDKTVTVPAQQWVRNVKTKKDLALDWVFAGSILYKDPDEKKPVYLATSEGAYICVTNVPTAMMDLPIPSAKDPEHREFAPHTERIPDIGTKVVIILEPIPNDKKK